MRRGPEGRRVLHADSHRPADRRDHRAVPRPDLRPRLRLGRHVRPVAPSSSTSTSRIPTRELSIYGQEKADETVRLCRMNLAVHGLSGDIRQAQQLLRGPPRRRRQLRLRHGQSAVQRQRRRQGRSSTDDRAASPSACRAPTTPTTSGSSSSTRRSNETGRAGFVMANSASDARASEQEIRRKLIEAGAVDVMVAVGPNIFYTVTLPVHAVVPRPGQARHRPREDTVLFIDARHIYRQIDRAHRDFTARADRVPRQHRPALSRRGAGDRRTAATSLMAERFPDGALRRRARPLQGRDARRDRSPGLEPQPRPLRRRRRPRDARRRRLRRTLEALNEELEALNAQARELEERIARTWTELLEGSD